MTLEQALNDEHHVRATGIVFIEHDRNGPLEGPDQYAWYELGDLLAVADHDHVAANQVGSGDVSIEIDTYTGPIESRGYLFDMR